MFDIGWMELMIVGIVMLLVVGPKELPALLRTIGKYAGMVKKQANEFRAQFDEAIKDSEFSDLKKDMENLGEETEATMRDAQTALNEDVASFDDHSTLDDDDFKDDDWVKGVVSPEDKVPENKAPDPDKDADAGSDTNTDSGSDAGANTDTNTNTNPDTGTVVEAGDADGADEAGSTGTASTASTAGTASTTGDDGAESGSQAATSEERVNGTTGVNGHESANGHDMSEALPSSGEAGARKAQGDERKSDA